MPKNMIGGKHKHLNKKRKEIKLESIKGSDTII